MKLPSRNSVTGQVLRLMPNGKAVYVYHLVSVSHSAGLELDAEKRLQSDVPFTCGGDR